jgi:hypothetical protein
MQLYSCFISGGIASRGIGLGSALSSYIVKNTEITNKQTNSIYIRYKCHCCFSCPQASLPHHSRSCWRSSQCLSHTQLQVGGHHHSSLCFIGLLFSKFLVSGLLVSGLILSRLVHRFIVSGLLIILLS